MSIRIDIRRLNAVRAALRSQHGPQHWWPASSAFEVMVGAVLVQNTAWTNVERAIGRLRAAGALDPGELTRRPREEVAELIRPSGYFNIKAERLRNLCRWYLDQGDLAAVDELETDELRRRLLSIKGVGPETCDDILLYAFHRPIFVVDAYTLRIFERLGLIPRGMNLRGRGYEALRQAVERAVGPDTAAFNELHALIVSHGKELCRPRPRCAECELRRMCGWHRESG
jgi:endonuclease-3 related protein